MSKRADIGLLVMISILFGASVGILHGRKKNKIEVTADGEVTLSTQDALDLMQPLLMAGSLDIAAQSMQQFSEPVVIDALMALINNQGVSLTDQEKVALIIGLAHYNPKIQSSLFTLLKKQFPYQPIFLIGAQHQYGDAIPPLLVWAKDYSRILAGWIYSSLHGAVEINNPDLIDQLYAQGLRLDSSLASKLLYAVVHGNKDVAFVPFFVRRFGANVDYSPDGKHSLLMDAVGNRNESMARALLEEGANPSLILDDEVGSAAQIAYDRGYAAIEQLIRSSSDK